MFHSEDTCMLHLFKFHFRYGRRLHALQPEGKEEPVTRAYRVFYVGTKNIGMEF